jgi:hypothetical protein
MAFEVPGKPSPYSPAQKRLREQTAKVFGERRASLALCYGQTDVRSLGDDVLVITRTFPGETVRVVLNRGSGSVTVRINDLGPDARVVAGQARLSTLKAEVPAQSFVYLKSNH